MTNKTKLVLAINFLLLLPITMTGKKKTFELPIKIPISLSGNFAEIRKNHFHSGIDIRTQGRGGFPIYSIDSGYISRIKIQSGGYGNAIYINHNNGLTSVYAHLDRLSDALKKTTEKKQYEKESFEIDLLFTRNEIKVKRDELIGYSGNSGSSGGPHLHFEIRDSKTQNPLDPIMFFPIIKDNIAPSFNNLYIYNTKNQLFNKTGVYKLHKKGNKYYSNQNLIKVPKNFTFGIEMYDHTNESRSRNGIKETKVYFDNILFFTLKIDSFSFAKTRYANCVIDYFQKKKYKRNVYRTHILPNNLLNIYKSENNGIITLTDYNNHNIKFVSTDSHGNTSTLETTIKRSDSFPSTKNNQILSWNQDYTLNTNEYNLDIKKNSLYSNTKYDISISYDKKTEFPTIHFATFQSIFHKPFNISYDISNKTTIDFSKVIWCSINNKGQITETLKTKIKENKIIGESRETGYFTIKIDTIAPQIKILNIENKKYLSRRRICAIIKDDISGIKSYNGYINNQWVLFKYDAKKNLLTYNFDEKIIKDNSEKTVSIYVSDYCGNIDIKTTKFIY